ncbi:MotA/TolQ/ExbB proton channel family protein [Parasalinivibrio latis]|uniref:MotA/TolQ/ExbB proton channel family protein n=1 Tax=Parasalinivibrio latis TaxID=2952610 RepID=UPI0030E1DBD0
MKLKSLPLLLASALVAFSLVPSVQANIVNDAANAKKQTAVHNQAREAGFNKTEKFYREKLNALKAQKVSLEKQTEVLSQDFTRNEENLAQLEEKLRLETGSLGELFGVVRQASKNLQGDARTAVTAIGQSDYLNTLDDVVAAEKLPSLAQLDSLWKGMNTQLRASSGLEPITVDVLDASGAVSKQQVYRVGNLGLVGINGYLDWDAGRNLAKPFETLPENGPTSEVLDSFTDNTSLLLDPSRGIVLSQLAQQPTLEDRFMQGGIVGYVIAGLLAVGLLIALIRGSSLMVTRLKISNQIKHPEKPGNNPLGRVLNVYHQHPDRSLETLELRLLETIVDEQQGCEKGLSMLKLLAALAPMLGLLGTVTGMIETFQTITQYGNGDPKVMAGGISMALVTTVLGLIAAMPLLLAHNVLSSQADAIRGTLEKYGISLVAEQSEIGLAAANTAGTGKAA